MSSTVQTFSVTNKWVFGLFGSVLLSQEAQPDPSMTRVLPEDEGREIRDEGNVRRARHQMDVGPRLFAVWSCCDMKVRGTAREAQQATGAMLCPRCAVRRHLVHCAEMEAENNPKEKITLSTIGSNKYPWLHC